MKRLIVMFAIFSIHFNGFLESQEYNHKGLNTWIIHSFIKDIKYVQDLGIHTVRIDIPWQLIEPEQNKFEWSKTDDAVSIAQANHIEILFTLRSISSWATKLEAQKGDIYHNASSPKNMKEWVSFVETFASRYKDRNVNYEIENEANMPNFWKGTLD